MCGATQVPAFPVQRGAVAERRDRGGGSRADDDERGDRRPGGKALSELARKTRGIASAATRASVPNAIALPRERRRPADTCDRHGRCRDRTTSRHEERRGQREAEHGAEHERVHFRIPQGNERQEDLVEVDHAGADVAQRRREDALVTERQELPRLRAERDPRRPERRRDEASRRNRRELSNAGTSPRAATTSASRIARGSSRLSQAAVTASAATTEATSVLTMRGDSDPACREHAARSSPMRTTAVGTPCAARRSTPGSVRAGRAAKLAESTQTTETLRRPATASNAVKAAGSSVAVTTASSPPVPGMPASARARPQGASGRAAARARPPRRAPPLRRAHLDRHATSTGRHQHRSPAANGVRLQDRPRDPHRRVEARAGSCAHVAGRIAVEEHHHPAVDVSSSSLTISWPRRALVGQCTRRSDCPCSYCGPSGSRNRRRAARAACVRRRRRYRRRRRAHRELQASVGRPASCARRPRAGDRREAEEIPTTALTSSTTYTLREPTEIELGREDAPVAAKAEGAGTEMPERELDGDRPRRAHATGAQAPRRASPDHPPSPIPESCGPRA